ncbi:MAG TPA: hypothetical protein VIQ51_03430 [Chryseosolibacter sp.]
MRSDQELTDTASRLTKESNPEIVQELKEHIQKLATMQTDVAPLKHLVIPPDERKDLQKIARTLKGTRSVKEKGNIIRNINAMGNLGRTERIFLNALRMGGHVYCPKCEKYVIPSKNSPKCPHVEAKRRICFCILPFQYRYLCKIDLSFLTPSLGMIFLVVMFPFSINGQC